MKIGLIARMDRTGLGQGQTLRLARILDLNCIMLIDSTPFNGNEQHPEWYQGYFKHVVEGFPTDDQVREFLEHVDVVISCETFYNNNFTQIAKDMGKKTVLIANYEFFDWHRPQFANVLKPDKVIVPSLWHFEEMQENFGADYIPTPVFYTDFAEAREKNLSRKITDKRRYLFINGKQAVHDRNGLMTMYDALKYTDADFELVIRCQGEPQPIVTSSGITFRRIEDPRVIYDFADVEDQADMYEDFDALIMPRRYAGQCLPMNEALQSALPVIMTDIDPNNRILPKEWLFPAEFMGTFMTRKPIELYSGNPKALAALMDTFTPDRDRALELAKAFSVVIIKRDLERIINSL